MHSLDVFALIFCQKQVVVMQEEKEVEVAEYDDEYNSWEPITNLSCIDLIEEYEFKQR